MKEPGRLAGLFFLADARTRSQAIALVSVNVSGATEVCADILGWPSASTRAGVFSDAYFVCLTAAAHCLT